MSRVQTTPGLRLDVGLSIDEVIAQVGFLDATLLGAVRERFYQATDHHRRSVFKHVKATWPGGLKAMRMVASRFHRYSAGDSLSKLKGESFAAYSTKNPALDREALERLETGGKVNPSGMMAIPIGAGARQIRGRLIPTKQFTDALKNRQFVVINGKTVKGLLVKVYDATRRKGEAIGERSVILGKLIKGRTQRPLLGFYDSADRVMPKHQAQMEKDLEAALTVAGRQRLQRRMDSRAAQSAAYRSVFQAGKAEVEKLTGKDAAKGYSALRRAASEAAKAVRANRVTGAGSEGGGA